MKKKIYIIITLTVLTALSFGMTSSTKDVPIDIPTKIELAEIQRINQQTIIDSINQYHQIELDEFLNAIGHRESTNRYDVVNKWGYMGRYQFGKSTLRGLGYDVSKKEFLSNPELQEEAMLSLLTHNKEKLQKYIDIFD